MFRARKFLPKNGEGRGFFVGMGKAECLRLCRALIEQRRASALEAMQAAQEAANGEGKSSAGDKYETARAMAHADRDRAARQLAEADDLAAQLARIEQMTPTTEGAARVGHLVVTDRGMYLLGLGLGRVAAGPPAVFALSLQAPAAKPLLGAKVGDTLPLPGGSGRVLEIL